MIFVISICVNVSPPRYQRHGSKVLTPRQGYVPPQPWPRATLCCMHHASPVFHKSFCRQQQQTDSLAWVDLVQVTPNGWSPLDSWYSCHFGSFCHLGQDQTCQENIVLIFFGSQCKIQGKIDAQIYFGHNFWPEGPTDLWSTPLSYIFHALFRDTPLGYVQHT